MHLQFVDLILSLLDPFALRVLVADELLGECIDRLKTRAAHSCHISDEVLQRHYVYFFFVHNFVQKKCINYYFLYRLCFQAVKNTKTHFELASIGVDVPRGGFFDEKRVGLSRPRLEVVAFAVEAIECDSVVQVAMA